MGYENDTESNLSDLEREVDQLETEAEQASQHTRALVRVVEGLAGDVEAIEALRPNEEAAEKREEGVRERRDDLRSQLSQLDVQLKAQMAALDSDRSVLNDLSSIGEDVTEPMAALDEKQRWLEYCQEQMDRLGNRLDVALEAYDFDDSSAAGVVRGSTMAAASMDAEWDAEPPSIGEAGAESGVAGDLASDFDIDKDLWLDGSHGGHTDERGMPHRGVTPGYGAYRSPSRDQFDAARRLTDATVLHSAVQSLTQTNEPTRSLSNGGTLYDSPERQFSRLNWYQALANSDYRGTCGLCSVQNIARLAGKDLSEADIINLAIQYGLCETDAFAQPGERGGTDPHGRRALLALIGIESYLDHRTDAAHIADLVEGGRGVIVSVDVRNFWRGAVPFDEGGGHAVVVTSVERDCMGHPTAFHLCDSGLHDADYVVSVEQFSQSVRAGRPLNVTNGIIR